MKRVVLDGHNPEAAGVLDPQKKPKQKQLTTEQAEALAWATKAHLERHGLSTEAMSVATGGAVTKESVRNAANGNAGMATVRALEPVLGMTLEEMVNAYRRSRAEPEGHRPARFVEINERYDNEETRQARLDARAAGHSEETVRAASARMAPLKGEATYEDFVEALEKTLAAASKMPRPLGVPANDLRASEDRGTRPTKRTKRGGP